MYDTRDESEKDLQLIYQKEMMKAQIDVTKARCLNEIRDEYAQKKEVRSEIRREMRKAQYNKIVIGETGKLILKTENSWIDVPERKIANFKFLGLFPLISSEGENGIFVLNLEIINVEKYVYLDEAKIGKSGYMFKKITAVGGKIFEKSQKEKESILQNFWTSIYPICTQEIVIPVKHGWVSLGKNNYKFVKEGELVWKDYVKKTR